MNHESLMHALAMTVSGLHVELKAADVVSKMQYNTPHTIGNTVIA